MVHLEAVKMKKATKERMDGIAQDMKKKREEADPFELFRPGQGLRGCAAILHLDHRRTRNGDVGLRKVARVDQVLQHGTADNGGHPLALGLRRHLLLGLATGGAFPCSRGLATPGRAVLDGLGSQGA